MDYRDLKFRTPLMIASTKGLTDIARLLLEKGADISVKISVGQPCITLCKSHVDTCVMLIQEAWI